MSEISLFISAGNRFRDVIVSYNDIADSIYFLFDKDYLILFPKIKKNTKILSTTKIFPKINLRTYINPKDNQYSFNFDAEYHLLKVKMIDLYSFTKNFLKHESLKIIIKEADPTNIIFYYSSSNTINTNAVMSITGECRNLEDVDIPSKPSEQSQELDVIDFSCEDKALINALKAILSHKNIDINLLLFEHGCQFNMTTDSVNLNYLIGKIGEELANIPLTRDFIKLLKRIDSSGIFTISYSNDTLTIERNIGNLGNVIYFVYKE